MPQVLCDALKDQHKKGGDQPFGCPLTPLMKTAATYSPTVRSTIGAARLNFSVRDGKRWIPRAIATWMPFKTLTGATRENEPGGGDATGVRQTRTLPAKAFGPLVPLG